MASAPQEFGTEAWREHVCGQVYAEAESDDPSDVEEFVDTFIALYGVADLGDVNALLGREAHARQNYEGQLGMVRAQ